MKILIIKLSSMGDVIHGMPVVAALKKIDPETEIHWLVNRSWAPLIKTVNGVNGLFEWDREAWKKSKNLFKNIKAFFILIHRLRNERFDVVIDLQCLFRSGFFAWVSGAPTRIGLDNARELSEWFYNQTAPVKGKGLHAIDQNMQVIKILYPSYPNCKVEFQMTLPEEVLSSMSKKTQNITGSKKYCVFSPEARWPSKRWELDHFKKLAQSIVQEQDFFVFIVGQEKKTEQAFFQKEPAQIVSLIHQTSLVEMAILISGAQFLVCNDSGPMHLAVALGIPVLALMGPTSPLKTGPYQNAILFQSHLDCSPCFKRICPKLKNSSLCLKKIQTEEVMKTLREKKFFGNKKNELQTV